MGLDHNGGTYSVTFPTHMSGEFAEGPQAVSYNPSIYDNYVMGEAEEYSTVESLVEAYPDNDVVIRLLEYLS